MPKGLVHIFDVNERSGLWVPQFSFPNQIQHMWGYLACQCLGRGDAAYKIAGFYIEYENVADPDDAVSPPSFEREDGIEYYQALTGNRDYLRVLVRGKPSIEIAPGFDGVFDEEAGQGNKLIFYGQSQGVVGMNGLSFSDAANSKVFGLALVAMPDPDDAASDLIFARSYYPVSRQKVKELGSQIGVSWEQTFEEL